MCILAAESRHQPKALSPIILPDDLIAEVLSWLTVKSLVRLKCVSKSWNSRISSDPSFVKMHLKKSARNAHLTLLTEHCTTESRHVVVNCFPIRPILEKQFITFADDPYYRIGGKDRYWVVGSCNGLLCVLGYSVDIEYQEFWLTFWNPATRSISEKLGFFRLYGKDKLNFMFGYDNSTDTYKVVAFRPSEVRVFSLGDNVWRNIQSFSEFPLSFNLLGWNDGVYLSNSINWLALRNNTLCDYVDIWMDLTIDRFVIISLDLQTETYTQWLPPRGFDQVSHIVPVVYVLKDYLCFCHLHLKETNFVIWQMREFGVEESWTQILTFSYRKYRHVLHHDYDFFSFFPLHLSENGDSLILANIYGVFLFNHRDNRVERTRITNKIFWYLAKDYVESLVSTCWKSTSPTSSTSVIDGTRLPLQKQEPDR